MDWFKRLRLPLLIGGIVVVCVLFVGIAYLLFFPSREVSIDPPVVVITQPLGNQSLSSGEALVIFAQATAGLGVQRIDLLVDGALVQSQPNPAALQEYSALFPWFSSSAGEHIISVVGYDTVGRASEPAVLLATVEPNPGAVGAEGAPEEALAGAALGPVDEEGQPVGEPAPQEAPPPAGGEAGGEGEGEAPAPDGEAAGGEEANPDVTSPFIQSFEYQLVILDDQVSIVMQAEAQDDRSMERMVFTIGNDGGGAAAVFPEICDGAPNCVAEVTVPLAPGDWLMAVQAFDAAGNASEAEREFAEVIGADDQPPAAADHDDVNPWLEAWLERNPLQDPVFDEPINAQEMWERFLEGEEEEQAEENQGPEPRRDVPFRVNDCDIVLPVRPPDEVTNCPGANLVGADLVFVDLRYANFQGAELRGAQLNLASLSWANLIGANLNGANLSGSSFREADFSEANLANANFVHSWGVDSVFNGANLYDAFLAAGNFSNGQFVGADMRSVDFSSIDLTSANLSNGIFRGIETRFHHAILTEANLNGGDFQGVHSFQFDQAVWGDTTCPDGTNSDNNPNDSCIDHLNP